MTVQLPLPFQDDGISPNTTFFGVRMLDVRVFILPQDPAEESVFLSLTHSGCSFFF
jgi:hypothetical protein